MTFWGHCVLHEYQFKTKEPKFDDCSVFLLKLNLKKKKKLMNLILEENLVLCVLSLGYGFEILYCSVTL